MANTNEKYSVNWESIVEKYLLIKKIYIECEETDPELKTNLQPLNEFRAALDHIIRIISQEKGIVSSEFNCVDEEEKLVGHLRRAFFDVCDMLSINYRKKIIDTLSNYGHETIKLALPDYYSTTRARIDEINNRIAESRFKKGQDISVEVDVFEEYSNVLLELRNIYLHIQKQVPVLEELHSKVVRRDSGEIKRYKVGLIVTSVLSLAGIITAIIVAVLG